MKPLRKSRKGTAEIVGTVFFLIILIFVFSNVFLWYNGVSQQVNTVMADRVNSPVDMEVTYEILGVDALKVSAVGGRDVRLLRIWIIEVNENTHAEINHSYIDFKEQLPNELWVASGSQHYFVLGGQTRPIPGYQNRTEIDYQIKAGVEVRFKILTDLGNIATASFP